jgi:hypothetical protein
VLCSTPAGHPQDVGARLTKAANVGFAEPRADQEHHVNLHSAVDEPPEPAARPLQGWAATPVVNPIHPQAVEAGVTLDAWLRVIDVLEARDLTPLTRQRLQDSRRLCQELANVLAGTEQGEGKAADRSLFCVRARGRTQAMSSMFACPRGTFIELLVTAPWNLLSREDPADPRTVRGAGTALVREAMARSHRRGCLGRVSLQAENPRTLPFYERFGFHRMSLADRPLTLVPPGEYGWSPSLLRVALGTPGPEEARSPWLVLDAGRRSEDFGPGRAA